jgi:hypothetical protein
MRCEAGSDCRMSLLIYEKCCKPNLFPTFVLHRCRLPFQITVNVIDAMQSEAEVIVLGPPCTSCVMATPSILQIDDHNPLVFYSPNSSWIRGGAASDFNGTSTHTSTPGASATLTFTGMHSIPQVLYSTQLTAQRRRS